MPRCVLPAARCAVLAALALGAAASALAQAPRTFPAGALRGEMVVTQPPEVLLNGRPSRLAPGARILDERNLLQLSGALVGRKLLVHYTRDPLGQPHTVWLLTPDEAARKPWPTSPEQAQAWFFDAAAQRWTPR